MNPANPEDTTLSTSTVVQYYLEQGVPAAQIVVGVGFYGRGWVGVPSTNNGLFQKYTTVPQGSWDDGQSGATG